MTGELVRIDAAPLTRRGSLTAELLKEEREQRQLLGQYVRECMVDGQDFGKIPGTDKPTLLKPGAEKLIDLFNCTPEFTLIPEFSREDFAAGFFKYTFRCRILSRATGAVLAEGYGSANSREQRYRWRTANRKCPGCQQEAIIAGKAEWGGGWVCFKRKGGCGAKFNADDTRITAQPQGRVENEDIADLDNTILKMAKKRAQVDGAIALARCSDMFTQDVEDLSGHDESEAPRTPPSESAPGPTSQPQKKPPLDPATTVVFGPHGGTAIPELSPEALEASIALAADKLKGNPKTDWAPKVRANLSALNAEAELRARTRPVTAATSARTDDDVPF